MVTECCHLLFGLLPQRLVTAVRRAVLLVVPSVADAPAAQRSPERAESIGGGSEEDVDGGRSRREKLDEMRTPQKQQPPDPHHRPTESMTGAAAAQPGANISWENMAITGAITTFAAMALAVVYLALASEDEASKRSLKKRR